jgi:hypothetical protein
VIDHRAEHAYRRPGQGRDVPDHPLDEVHGVSLTRTP